MTLVNDTVQQIIDSIDAHTIICNKTDIILANAVTLKWLSMSSEMLIGSKVQAFIHPSSNAIVRQTYDTLRQGSSSTSLRVLIKHPQKGNVWIDATIKPASFLDSCDAWMVTFIPLRSLPTMDMTQNEDFSQLENNTVLATMIEENYFVDTALSNFLDTLHDFIPYDSTSITLLHGNDLQFIITRGFPPDIDLSDVKIEGKKVIVDRASILYQNALGTVYYIPDTQQSEHWIDIDGTSQIRAWMGLELFYNQQLLGVLNIDSNTANSFTVEHAQYALALSQQATLALVYTRLYHRFYQESEDHKRLQRVLVKNLISTETMFATQDLLYSSANFATTLPVLVNMISASMTDTEIIVIVFNATTSKLIHKVHSQILDLDPWTIFSELIQAPDLPENTMPAKPIILVANNTPVAANKYQAIASSIDTHGAIIAVRRSSDDVFDNTDYELMTTISHQISITLRNEQLDNQLRQHTQQLERKVERRTEQLSIERKRLQAILDATAEGIFYMENFQIQYSNPAFCKMVGYESDELYGEPLSFVRVTPPSNDAQNFNALLNNPLNIEPRHSETRLRHQDGTEFYANIRFSLMGEPGEDPVRMVAIARDISQERKLYIQRARFIANAAHELRTPLSSLILRLHMLHRQPERLDVHLESLDKVAIYLKDLVEELLTISRYERGSISLETGTLILQPLVQQAIDEQASFAEELQVSVDLTMPEKPIEMVADATRLHQLASTLLINGINYSPPQSIVTITLSVEVDSLGNENVILQVVDDGEGIDPDLLPADIFEPFARPSGGKRKETGMGLALAKEIVNLHGGSIHAKSKLGKGSSFRVTLPLN